MKVIIAGGRDFSDYDLLCQRVNKILLKQTKIEIVSGAAKGADKLGERYAEEHGYEIIRFVADWNTFGKAAGYRRNIEMANYADALILFWDGISKGSKHMLETANEWGLKIRVITYK